ncbi:unnamed protein product [Adineta steineri]|uniref:Uncharacterized protein n=1 Tax=Adineta steineri TaxID=433720 RepID=A0A819ENU4_9BILA|nr:unnamed protein product [Adineta steineri]CAF1475116.1 unnamed protein product [Adineta steineri]CAF3678462.1 unnamed protein product [Adineta steineri]CAF3854067.1 unnamed protein product [Adineta steineri]
MGSVFRKLIGCINSIQPDPPPQPVSGGATEVKSCIPQLEIDSTRSSSQVTSSNTKYHSKEPHTDGWDEKYFIRGTSSNIMTDVKSQTHGCIDSCVSEDINNVLHMLHVVNIKADAILQDRIAKITAKEQRYMTRSIQQRENLMGKILIEGRSYANQYEERCRELIEEFIKNLEVEMSIHLDKLQQEIAADRETVFEGSNKTIGRITEKADRARNKFQGLLQKATAKKREEIMELINVMLKDTTRQSLGYEQLKTVQLQMYSTVGNKKDGQGCDNIDGREKFIEDIDNAKPHLKIKRTVYLGIVHGYEGSPDTAAGCGSCLIKTKINATHDNLAQLSRPSPKLKAIDITLGIPIPSYSVNATNFMNHSLLYHGSDLRNLK